MLDEVESVLRHRQESDGHSVLHAREFPAIPSRTVAWENAGLRPVIVESLRREFPAGLFVHQAEAIRHIRDGRDVVVTTRTSSGKSLIYLIPIAEALLSSSQATVILCYPLKALANDQLEKLKEFVPRMLLAAGQSAPHRMIERYDGSTREEEKPSIRQEARVLLTNPDMLHLSMLQFHDRLWERLLTNLKYVILDEAHDYRGTFGSNVALIMRRLLLLCERYGSKPQFISTSATMSDPAGHLASLTGRQFTVVGQDTDGSAQGRKRFWIVRPKGHFFACARDLMRDLVDRGFKTIAFCLSRKSTEQLAIDWPENDPRIAVYRAGLLPARREEIERGLKTGAIQGVFATNALELGIDIGALDVCMCIGFPSTMMSLWQRTGRVGRSGKDGAVILIADQRPLDSYYAQHPEDLFDRPNEPLALNMKSRTLAVWHYGCALKEANRSLDRLVPEQLPEPLRRIAREHQNEGLSEPAFFADNVHLHFNVRAGVDSRFDLVSGGQKIGEINHSQILREAAPHAIYLHNRYRYRVMSVHDHRREVRLQREYSHNRTDAFVQVKVRMQQPWKAGQSYSLHVLAGRLLVSEKLVSLTERRPDGTVVAVHTGSQGIKDNNLPTTGVVVTVKNPYTLVALVEYAQTERTRRAWNGLGPLLKGILPAVLGPCDPADFGIHSEWGDSEGNLYFFDQAYEGIDLTLPVADRIPDLFQAALDSAQACDCREDIGCLSCVRDPFADVPTDKEATTQLLKAMIRALSADPIRIEDLIPAPDRLAKPENQQTCLNPICGKRQPIDARFCSNCGSRLGQ